MANAICDVCGKDHGYPGGSCPKPDPTLSMAEPDNTISLKSICPPAWKGELTEEKFDMIISGLEVPSQAMSVRLARELKARMFPEKPDA